MPPLNSSPLSQYLAVIFSQPYRHPDELLSLFVSYHVPECPSSVVQQLIKEILDYFKFLPVTVSWRAFVYLLKPLQVSLHSDTDIGRLSTFVSHCVRSQSSVTEPGASPALRKNLDVLITSFQHLFSIGDWLAVWGESLAVTNSVFQTWHSSHCFLLYM